LLELINTIEDLTGCHLDHVADKSRPGDQLVYITDYGKLQRHTGWRPLINLRQTLGLLQHFWEENRDVLASRATSVQLEPFATVTGNSGRAA
jgi:UDP-glucose 4-epimerase